MQLIRAALLSAICATSLAAPAFAWPTIDVTASEVLSVDPPRVRTTFEVGSSGYEPGCIRQYMRVTPLDPQALHIFECAAPPGWNCGDAGSGAVYFLNANNAPGFTFSIVSELVEPCVEFYFPDPLLAKATGSTVNYDCVGDACLVLDGPVPARLTTWGSLKVQYR